MARIVVGIHEGLQQSFPRSLVRFEKTLLYNQVSCLRLNVSVLDFWEKIRGLNYFIYRFAHLNTEIEIARAILPVIEQEYKIPCHPNQATMWHYDDKIRQYYLLKTHNLPVADTWVFWDMKIALEWLETSGFPVVLKLKGGAGSANVVLVKNEAEAKVIIKKLFSPRGISSNKIPLKNSLNYYRNLGGIYGLRKHIASIRKRLAPGGPNPYWQIHRDYVLFQRFYPNNKYDVRVTVIGDRAFAFLRYTRAKDFRASGSGLLDYDQTKIDPRCIEIAFMISEKLGFQSMAYDFVFDESNEPKIVEISYVFVDAAVHGCPGYFDRSLNRHEGHFWPQFCILSDLIKEIDLKQPPENILS